MDRPEIFLPSRNYRIWQNCHVISADTLSHFHCNKKISMHCTSNYISEIIKLERERENLHVFHSCSIFQKWYNSENRMSNLSLNS